MFPICILIKLCIGFVSLVLQCYFKKIIPISVHVDFI